MRAEKHCTDPTEAEPRQVAINKDRQVFARLRVAQKLHGASCSDMDLSANFSRTRVFIGENMARPGGLELPAFWFVAVEAGNLSASDGVAYGRFRRFPLLLSCP